MKKLMILMLVFLPLRHGLLSGIFFNSNVFMVGLNILPIPVSDGYRVWKCFERMIHADKRECKI